uniref:Legume lectin domain-containing protein n=1 Tax=Leersia perrieri TaxID=77586 RepID=A0A0D9VMB9_9ORYZ
MALLPFLVLLFLCLGGLRPTTKAADEQFIFNGFTGTNLSFYSMATVTSNGRLMLTNSTSMLKGNAF